MSHRRQFNHLHRQQLLRLRRPLPLPYGCQTASRLVASALATLQPSSSRSSPSAPFSSSARLPHLPPCPSASSSSSLALGGSHSPSPPLSGFGHALVHPYPPTSLPHCHGIPLGFRTGYFYITYAWASLYQTLRLALSLSPTPPLPPRLVPPLRRHCHRWLHRHYVRSHRAPPLSHWHSPPLHHSHLLWHRRLPPLAYAESSVQLAHQQNHRLLSLSYGDHPALRLAGLPSARPASRLARAAASLGDLSTCSHSWRLRWVASVRTVSSFFGQLIPKGHEVAFYALFAITDKGSSAIGPAVVGRVVDATGSIRPAFWFLTVLVAVARCRGEVGG